MGEVITIGLDIAKSVFQVHGVDEAGALGRGGRLERLVEQRIAEGTWW